VEAELEALRSSAAQVQDFVLGDANVSSLLAMSLSAVAERLEGWIDAGATNRVHWGSCSAFVTAVSHFPELATDLEVPGYGRNAGIGEDEVDAL
jgi:hypothetical protein